MITLTDEINWKGIGDYLSAARTLTEHGSSNVASGPVVHCRGLAVELALKFFLRDQRGHYPGTHNLEKLAFEESTIAFTQKEREFIKNLNRQYFRDDKDPYPSRYRPTAMRVVISPGQSAVEDIVATIVSATSQANLIERIFSR